jgi:hypothetical protein
MGTYIFLELIVSRIVATKGRPEKKQTGWCSDNETGGGDGKAEIKLKRIET